MKKHIQSMNEEEIFEKLHTNHNGLKDKEVKQRIQKLGLNELPKKEKDSIFKIFFSQFCNSITIIMIVACILSLYVNEVVDALAIVFIIMIDAVMGTIQEWKANKSADALASMIKVKAAVIRNGKEIMVDASELTIGDIVLLESGVKISADARIISCSNLTIDEAVLTGESIASVKNSLPSNKTSISDSKNMVYAGTSVITGRGTVVVTAVGNKTEIGKIASKVIETEDTPSPLSIRMSKFTKQISMLIVFIAILLIILLTLKGGYKPEEILMNVIGLAVSAMPEGLPLSLTLALTIGSSRMGKKNVITKKLNSVESLGSCTVIASDKTGTLTVNEQTAKKVLLPNGVEFNITGTGYNFNGKINGNKDKMSYLERIAKNGVLNNEAGIEVEDNITSTFGDSIDIAFLVLGKKAKIDTNKIEKVGSIPYESENKYSAVYYKEDKKVMCTAKGSLEVIFEFCDHMYYDDTVMLLDKDKILKQNEQLAKDGYRVIALAANECPNFKEKEFYEKEDVPKLIFLGFVAFIDPIREEAKESIQKCKRAGIKVVMVTGDHPLTAFSIAKDLELTDSFDEVANGEDIDREFNKGEESFDEYIKTKVVFTRVTPIQKLEIIESYKRQGEFVAVTGDGVNDAPAIKAANIGIAMGSGSDVAKETSNMIIIDDNFMSIVAGIEEGRNAYANIRKVVYMLISCGFAEVLFFLLSIISGLPMPLVAVQLLWLNLVTDGLQDLALSFEREEDDIMDEKPRDPKESLFDKRLIEEIAISGLYIGFVVFITWLVLLKHFNMPVENARGYIMALMVFMQNIHVLNCRSEKKSTFKKSLCSNWLIVIAIVSSIALQVILMEVEFLSKIMKTHQVPFEHMIMLILVALPILFIMEMYKKIRK